MCGMSQMSEKLGRYMTSTGIMRKNMKIKIKIFIFYYVILRHISDICFNFLINNLDK